ncbi:MAG: SulP family inorganic anion transporter [Ilumatobacteraceae bacterium]
MRVTRAELKRDAIAGIPGAISSVPDGMAAAVLAGINPIHGLYASFAGPTVGGLATSTRLMVITTTSAAALAAGSALKNVPAAERPQAMFLLTLLAGAAMIAAGIAKLGRYTRFVTQSVMIGFLTGVAVNIVCGQLRDLTGTDPDGRFAVTRAFWVVTHPGEIHVPSLLVGLGAIALLLLLARTPLRSFSAIIALVVPTAVVLIAGLDRVARVSDSGEIPQGIPLPHLPELSQFSIPLVMGALTVAAIVLVQGAGVSESAQNLDGTTSDANRDFIAQGAGNVASGLFLGQPVGGSVGQTALNVAAGGRTRWAAVFSGIWMLLILALFSGVVGKVAMPTLAAVLIVAGAGSIRTREALAVWRTSLTAQVAMATTFLATLVLPVAAAVGIGVALSIILQLNREALDLAVVEVYFTDEGRPAERPAPARLPDHGVTILAVYGSLYYAGARTLQARLPDPTGTTRPAVVLRLRGRMTLGATFYAVLEQYASRLAAVGGTLTLTGLAPGVVQQMERTRRFDMAGPVTLYPATEVLFESTERGYRDAQAWTVTHRTHETTEANEPNEPNEPT